jgi:ABC-type dipeptide/oligopeptide/nickel transport system ATPase component
MDIKEHKSHLIVNNSKNNLDKELDPNISPELPNYNGFSWVIVGSSGSGKTTLLYSLMKGKKINGIRHGYNKVFDKIYVISPTIGNDSIKNDPFKTLPDNQIYRELTLEHLEEIQTELEDNRSNGLNSVLILDDVGSELKKSKAIEKKLTAIIQNRRHLGCSVFILLQKFKDAQTGIRNNMSHFTSFRPKNMGEKDAIIHELFDFNKEESNALMDYVFDDKHNFLYVDLSLRTSGQYQFYKNFNLLSINKIKK